MTRTKSTPPLRKPLFDEAEVISFAAMGEARSEIADAPAATKGRERKAAKKADAERAGLTLTLLPETVARLKAEAARKDRTIDQVVEKLVHKHLSKH